MVYFRSCRQLGLQFDCTYISMIGPQLLIGGVIGFALGYLAHNEQNFNYLEQTLSQPKTALGQLRPRSQLVESPIQVIKYPYFKILYSKTLKIPVAVQQTITKEFMVGNADRSNVFFEEPQLQEMYRSKQEHFKKTQAYKKLNLSRGHMAAAGNYNFSREAKDQTFTYANIIPQDSDNNEDVWLTFETYQRELVSKCESVNIISGPVFKPQRSESEAESEHPILTMQYNILDVNGPAVPTHLYKVIRCNQPNGNSHVSGFEFKNKYSNDNARKLRQFQVPLQYLQKQTGLFFHFDESSLVEFDKQTFEMTKEEYNKKVLYPRILRAKRYDEVEQQIRKLKGHKIKQQQDITMKIEELVEAKLQQSYNSSCERVVQQLDLASNLRRYRYLNERVSQKIEESLDTHINQCNEKEQLQRIKMKLEFAEKHNPNYSQKLQNVQKKLSAETPSGE